MAFGLLLAVVINVTILASYFVEIFAKKFNFHIFSFSFEEGNSNNIIEIQANQEIEQLLGNKLLLQYISDKKSNDFHYRLASKSRIDIEQIRQEANDYKGVTNIDVKFC